LRRLRGQRTPTRRRGGADYVRLLEAGINVVTTTVNRLIHPAGVEPDIWREQLTTAAAAGGASLPAASNPVSPQTISC
jgi:hypothetical protein